MSPAASRRVTPDRSGVAPTARRSTFDGRLIYPTGHGRRSLIVRCCRTGDDLAIRLPEFNEASNYLTDATVALTSVSDDSVDTPAVITGHSHLVADQDMDDDTISALEQWPAGIRGRYFLITETHDRPVGPGRRRRHNQQSRRGIGHDRPQVQL